MKCAAPAEILRFCPPDFSDQQDDGVLQTA
jgi:hypothetical protein